MKIFQNSQKKNLKNLKKIYKISQFLSLDMQSLLLKVSLSVASPLEEKRGERKSFALQFNVIAFGPLKWQL